MTESEGEIEYLDEDADIVQKCVQSSQTNVLMSKPPTVSNKLLVEQVPAQIAKKKKPKDEDSSDYDPEEDLRLLKKRKVHPIPRSQSAAKPLKQPQAPKDLRKSSQILLKEDLKIHDHDDPLCLPVKYFGKDAHDAQQRNKWNNLCLQRLKNLEVLRPRTGPTVSSKRVIVLRNVTSNLTRKMATTMWSKTVVENKDGDKNTEVCQSVLPKFRERTVLEYNMPTVQKKRGTRTVNTVVLSKEQHKDGEVMVAYQPLEAVSSVYKLIDRPGSPELEESSSQRHLRRSVALRACAPCYQASWRPTRAANAKKEIKCPICSQPFLSVHNLLSHARAHKPGDVRARSRDLARILAQIVGYHYRCRICQQTFLSIRETRKHVATHKSREKFRCEIGNHLAH